MGYEIGKMLCAKPRVSINMRVCHATNVVTMLTQPGYIAEQLNGSSRVKMRKIGTVSKNIVQSVSYLSRQGIDLSKDKQDEESNFKQILLLRAEDDDVLQKWNEKS